MTPFMGCKCIDFCDYSRNSNVCLFCFLDGYGYTQEYGTLGKSLQCHKPLGPGSFFSGLLERLPPLIPWDFCCMAKDSRKQ